MIYLIIMQCALLDCKHIEIVDEFKTMADCEKAMKLRYDDLKPGSAVMCIGDLPEVIKT